MAFLESLRLRFNNYLTTICKNQSLTSHKNLVAYLEIKVQKTTSHKRMNQQLDHQVFLVIKVKSRRHQMSAHLYSRTISRICLLIKMLLLNNRRLSLEIQIQNKIRNHSLKLRAHSLIISHNKSLCLHKVLVCLHQLETNQ